VSGEGQNDLRAIARAHADLKAALRTMPESETTPGGAALLEADALLEHLNRIKAKPPAVWSGDKARLLALAITHLEESRGRLVELMLACTH